MTSHRRSEPSVIRRQDWARVGATEGLTSPCGPDCPEQTYVYLTKDDDRPVAIEGWVGYRVDSRLRLTRRQARELIVLLTAAVLGETEGGGN